MERVDLVDMWFRGGLVCKAHRLFNHSTLGWRVIQKKKKYEMGWTQQDGSLSRSRSPAIT